LACNKATSHPTKGTKQHRTVSGPKQRGNQRSKLMSHGSTKGKTPSLEG